MAVMCEDNEMDGVENISSMASIFNVRIEDISKKRSNMWRNEKRNLCPCLCLYYVVQGRK